MNSSHPFSFFGYPVTRRTFILCCILCPGLGLAIYLSTLSRTAATNSVYSR